MNGMCKRILLSLLALVVLSAAAKARQDESCMLKGRITDTSGEPIPGAAVAIIGTLSGTYSGADGYYSVRLNNPGHYKIKYSFTGYGEVIKELDIMTTIVSDVVLERKLIMTQEVVVSATRAAGNTPVAYSLVTGEEIKKMNSGQDLPFIIGNTPSLVETSEAGTGIGYTSFRIRGTDGSRINVTVDGVPLNDAESQQVFWVDLPDLASSVDNIQVQRGVGTSSNGAGAFGASINLLTQSIDNQPFAAIYSSYGSFNSLKNTITAGTGTISDKFAIQLRYSDIKSDGYIQRTRSDNRSGELSAVYRNKKSFLKANILLGEEHTGISWWGVPADMLSTDRTYNPAGEYTDQSGIVRYYENESDNYWQNHYRLNFGTELGQYLTFNMALHLTTGKGYYEEYREDQLYSDYGLPPVINDTSELMTTDLIRRKWLSNTFYGTVWSLNYKKNRLDVSAGGGFNNYIGNHYGRIIWMRYAGNTEKDFEWYRNDARKAEFSIYGKINYMLTEKLNSFADIQYRHIAYEMSGPDDDLKDLTQAHYFGFLNPKAGLFLRISPRHNAFISFSIANKEPTRSDFKEASGDNQATPRPETLYDAEAGYGYRGQLLTASVNIYGMIYHDQLVPTGELSNVGYPVMTNVTRSYRTGIELIAELKPAKWFNWNTNLTLSRNWIPGFILWYTDYNTSDWSENYYSKNMGTVNIAYSPEIIGQSDLAFNISEQLSVHLISKYVGKQYFDNTSSVSRMLDPYFVNNIRIDLVPDVRKIKSLEFRLLVNNFLNAQYVSNGYGGLWYEDGIEKTWAYYFPQAGINFMVSAGIKF
jgi:iron complex outermembrane recepter protein